MDYNIDNKVLVLIIILVVAVILIWSYSLFSSSRIISPLFAKEELAPGESTTLGVDVLNPYATGFTNVVVSVKPLDPTSITVGGSPQIEDVFGAGETRKFTFTVGVTEETRLGTYFVDVIAMFGSENQTRRIMLRVA
jgi:uncharacterized membrane protein